MHTDLLAVNAAVMLKGLLVRPLALNGYHLITKIKKVPLTPGSRRESSSEFLFRFPTVLDG